jgi:hypothetical protein
MLVEPQPECVTHYAGHEGRTLARGKTLLGLPAELRILHFYRQDITAIVPDIFRAELHAARQQVTELAELAHRLGQSHAQTVHMGTTLDGRDQVDVTFRNSFATLRQPGKRPFSCFMVAFHLAGKWHIGQGCGTIQRGAQVITQPVLVIPFLPFITGLIIQAHLQARAQHCFRTQHMPEAGQRKPG